MLSTSLHASNSGTKDIAADEHRARRARVARLDRLATRLDARFRVFGIPVGWDSIIGLVPGVGDVVTALPGATMVYEAQRMGARRRAAARIAVNTGLDMALGAIPFVGDLFDVAFKSHSRNIEILKDELARIEAREKVDARRSARRPQAHG